MEPWKIAADASDHAASFMRAADGDYYLFDHAIGFQKTRVGETPVKVDAVPRTGVWIAREGGTVAEFHLWTPASWES